MKYLYIIIAVLIGIIAYLYFNPKDTTETDRLRHRIDSLSTLIDKDKLTIQNLLKDAETSNLEQDKYKDKADSLAVIISSLHVENDCPEIVAYQKDEIKNLRTSLKKCNKVKVIQVTTITKYADIIVKHELIALETAELQLHQNNDCKKGKFKTFIAGLGIGGAIVLILVLL